jgi:hypothetical protein|tara:strand:- start:3052 stop:4038 length:987 start_codon:yes stop_codon:yes gene_type:complete
MTPTEKLELQVAEELDGSAIVQLPDSEPSPQASDNTPDDDDDDGPSGDYEAKDEASDNDPEREAIRAARREERKLKKQLHREKARESNHLISALKKQNNALADRLAVLEKKTSGAELARVDKAIDDAGVQVEYAKMKMKEAVSAQDGESLVQAQEMLYEAQRKMESLSTIKENATRQMTQQPKQNIQLPDPMVQKMAADWMRRNGWYDPQGKDLDSEIAQKIDRTLTEEGFDPTQEDYWEELDDRLQKYLPHRSNTGYNERNRNQRPRSVVTSSGRESSGGVRSNEFRLTPDRVAAIKEAGMWDNTEQRNKMIRKFADWDRQNKQNRG